MSTGWHPLGYCLQCGVYLKALSPISGFCNVHCEKLFRKLRSIPGIGEQAECLNCGKAFPEDSAWDGIAFCSPGCKKCYEIKEKEKAKAYKGYTVKVSLAELRRREVTRMKSEEEQKHLFQVALTTNNKIVFGPKEILARTKHEAVVSALLEAGQVVGVKEDEEFIVHIRGSEIITLV